MIGQNCANHIGRHHRWWVQQELITYQLRPGRFVNLDFRAQWQNQFDASSSHQHPLSFDLLERVVAFQFCHHRFKHGLVPMSQSHHDFRAIRRFSGGLKGLAISRTDRQCVFVLHTRDFHYQDQ